MESQSSAEIDSKTGLSELVRQVKQGFKPTSAGGDGLRPSIIEGTLDDDGLGAFAKLVEMYQSLVAEVASQYQDEIEDMPAIDIDDLISEGYGGILHAALTFSIDQKDSFRRLVRRYMERYIGRNRSLVYVPKAVRQEIQNLDALGTNLDPGGNPAPTNQWIASMPSKAVKDLAALREYRDRLEMGGSSDLDDPYGNPVLVGSDRNNPRMMPNRSPENIVMDEYTKLILEGLIAQDSTILEDNEKVVLANWLQGDFGVSEDIINEFGLTRPRYNALQRSLLDKLRNYLVLTLGLGREDVL